MFGCGIKMVVGLGNAGDKYIGTRHNIGFEVIEALATRLKTNVTKRKFGARLGMAEFADKKLILLKPWQLMNHSGQAVAKAAGFYKLAMSDLLVVMDDIALPPGRIRLRSRGSAGGHNGLADIIEKLGTGEFARCRVGIGQSDRLDAAVFVLDRPTKQERMLLEDAAMRATNAVMCWIGDGIITAMNKFNAEK